MRGLGCHLRILACCSHVELIFTGIAGTPVIDPSTNTAYFFAKGYQNGAASGGVANGIYK